MQIMTRPERNVIASGEAAWDGEVDSNFSIITESPFPIVSVADLATLSSTFAASSYDDCFAHVQSDDRLYISNGTSWELYDRQAANVADSVAATVSQMASDHNDMLTALKNSSLMASS